jgi:hypothetical protein
MTRSDQEGVIAVCRGRSRRIARPRWSWLYALVALPLAGLTPAEIVLPEGPLQTAAGGALVLGVFTAMAVWVRLNRCAIEQMASCDCAWDRVTVRVISSRRPEPPRTVLPAEPHDDELAAAVDRG